MERPEMITRGAVGVYLLSGLAALVGGGWPLLIVWAMLPVACVVGVLVQAIVFFPLMFLLSRLFDRWASDGR